MDVDQGVTISVKMSVRMSARARVTQDESSAGRVRESTCNATLELTDF